MKILQNMCLVLAAFILAACASAKTPHTEFLDLLDYEAQNRAFAYQSVTRKAQSATQEDSAPFWQAYADLEVLNRERYKPYLQKYHVPAEARWTTRVRGWAGGVVGSMFPQTALTQIHQATVAYIPKLHRLAALAPADADPLENLKTKEFFAFVVAQEEVQAEAMGLLAQGQILQGATHINSFVQQHRVPLPSSPEQ
ncbi:MAG: hypothetical protein P1U50_08750 [Parvibaculaceae bacterium]|nr:hypothetical protein [Parvibaculaceae bacterium]